MPFLLFIIGLLSLLCAAGNHLSLLEFFSHGQLTITALSEIAFLFSFRFRFRLLSSLLGLLLLYHLFTVAPVLPLHSPEPKESSSRFRVLLFNMNANNTAYPCIIDRIESLQPDLLVVCEANEHLTHRMDHLHDRYSHRLEAGRWPGSTLLGASGTILWSRFPMETAKVHTLDTAKIQILEAIVKIEDNPVQVFAMHSHSPVNFSQTRRRNASLNEVSTLLNPDLPTLVIGDLNNTLWSASIRRFARENHLTSAFQSTGIEATWPAFLSPFGIAIDHLFHSSEIHCLAVKTHPGCGSDHRMLCSELQIL